MERIVKPFNLFRKNDKKNAIERYIFANLDKNEIMFMTELKEDKDYASINFRSLDEHFNYGYRYQSYKNKEWINETKYKNIFVEHYHEKLEIYYSFYKHLNSKKLYVILSSNNTPRRYNYFKSFSRINENKLFLCDEVLDNQPHKCSYYYGYNGESKYEESIITLIMEKMEQLNLSREDVVLVGSSKGGFSALYYLFKYKFGTAIVGSPTIYLGSQHKETKFGKKLIKHITGMDIDPGSIMLDKLIIDEVAKSNHFPVIFYHIGKGEERYSEHAIPFIDYLVKNEKAKVHLDLGTILHIR